MPAPNGPSRLAALWRDLADEHTALDARLASVAPAAWTTPTPAEGWDVADSISHLAYFDHTATLALTDPDAFRASTESLLAGLGGLGEGSGTPPARGEGSGTPPARGEGSGTPPARGEGSGTPPARGDGSGTPPAADRPDVALGRRLGPEALLEQWREGRARLLDAVAGADPDARVPWYGPAMGLASFVSARLMETWAHGQDVADALWLPPVISPRLRHICHLGVTARPYAFAVHGVADPGDPVRVEALRPDGEVWTWGPPGAGQRLAGPALDLALVFTQRRHVADTAIVAQGETAELWLSLAQCFAGGPGAGRAPLELSGDGPGPASPA